MALAADGQQDSGAKGMSVLSTVEGWLSQTCAKKACTKSALTKASGQVESDCADDLDGGEYLPLLVKSMLDNFGTVRSTACEYHKKEKKYCASVVLQDFEVRSIRCVDPPLDS